MRRIIAIEAGPADHAAIRLELDYDLRCRRRAVFRPKGAAPILLDLERPVHLHDGQVLRLDDGGAAVVIAANELLLEIAAPDMPALVRIAWHLGNRHLPTQVSASKLFIRHDHVIAQMVEGLGGIVRPALAPFDPEGGAYAGGGGGGAGASAVHGHHHGHDDHDQRHIRHHSHG